ncbi:MAG: universal stress protein [Gammaproteobacteria bacterium]|nr:universal stress protein [Gammaproteobacteria bacterium]
MGAYTKILVALDLTAEAGEVLAKAKGLAQLTGAELMLMHVVEPLILDNTYESLPMISVDVEKALYERAQRVLKELAEQAGLADITCRVEVGSVKNEILQAAKSYQADVIVIGTHGRHGIALLLGSTANAVLHGTPCDVLAVKV